MLYLKLLYFILIFTLNGRNIIIPSFNLDLIVEEYYLLHQRELEDKSAGKGALVAHGSYGEGFLDEVMQQVET